MVEELFGAAKSPVEKAREAARVRDFGPVAARSRTQMEAAKQATNVQMAEPEFDTMLGRGLYSGASSLVQMTPGLAASVVTANPLPALANIAAITAAPTYQKYRERGATVSEAALGTAAETGVELATEALPLGFAVKTLGKVGFGQFLRNYLGRELPSEAVATITQNAIDTAIANPDKTWTDYVNELPSALGETAIATLVPGTVLAGASKVAQTLQREPRAATEEAPPEEPGAEADAAPRRPSTAPPPPADMGALAKALGPVGGKVTLQEPSGPQEYTYQGLDEDGSVLLADVDGNVFAEDPAQISAAMKVGVVEPENGLGAVAFGGDVTEGLPPVRAEAEAASTKPIAAEYIIDDPFGSDRPEQVGVVRRPDGVYITRGEEVIDVSHLAKAGMSDEQLIAWRIGYSTTGVNVRPVGAAPTPAPEPAPAPTPRIFQPSGRPAPEPEPAPPPPSDTSRIFNPRASAPAPAVESIAAPEQMPIDEDVGPYLQEYSKFRTAKQILEIEDNARAIAAERGASSVSRKDIFEAGMAFDDALFKESSPAPARARVPAPAAAPAPAPAAAVETAPTPAAAPAVAEPVTEQTLRDAGFTNGEIASWRSGQGSKDYAEKAGRGFIYYRGDFTPATTENVAEITSRIEADIAKNAATRERLIATDTGKRTVLVGDARPQLLAENLKDLETSDSKLKAQMEGLNRQLERSTKAAAPKPVTEEELALEDEEEIDYDEHPLMQEHEAKYDEAIDEIGSAETMKELRDLIDRFKKEGLLDKEDVESVNESINDAGKDRTDRFDAGTAALEEVLNNQRDNQREDVEERIRDQDGLFQNIPDTSRRPDLVEEPRNTDIDALLDALPRGERVNVRAQLDRITDRYEKNGDVGMLLAGLDSLRRDVYARIYRNQLKRARPRVRGFERAMEVLYRAERDGRLAPESAALARWLIQRNPRIADDLAFSFQAGNENSPAGQYNAFARLVTVFAGGADGLTAAHEILHHTERMMPEPIREGIRAAWRNRIGSLMEMANRTNNVEMRRVLGAVVQAYYGNEQAQRELAESFRTGSIPYSVYHLSNPSEFWAVNASELLSDRASRTGWVGAARNWLRDFIESVKNFFGFPNNAAVIRGLRAVLAAESGAMTGQMLANQAVVSNVSSLDEARARKTRDSLNELDSILDDLSKEMESEKLGRPQMSQAAREALNMALYRLDMVSDDAGPEFDNDVDRLEIKIELLKQKLAAAEPRVANQNVAETAYEKAEREERIARDALDKHFYDQDDERRYMDRRTKGRKEWEKQLDRLEKAYEAAQDRAHLAYTKEQKAALKTMDTGTPQEMKDAIAAVQKPDDKVMDERANLQKQNRGCD
jgi:hypothetical protein